VNNIFSGLSGRFGRARKQLTCPVCEQSNITFLSLSDFYQKEAVKYGYKHFGKGEMIAVDTYSCSNCGASDRERMYAWWIKKQIESSNLKKGAKLIHFAPEASLSKMIRDLNYFDYKTTDLDMEDVDYHENIMSMSFADNSFDFFICSHVLEHVEIDNKAIQELYRITKTGGCGILVAPVCLDIEETIEDPAMTTKAERWHHFGQGDHVRLYAHDDYVDKIKANGFEVDQLGLKDFSKETFMRLGLTDTSILYIVKKP